MFSLTLLMATHIPFEPSCLALHAFTIILTYLKFLWKYQFWHSILNLVKWLLLWSDPKTLFVFVLHKKYH